MKKPKSKFKVESYSQEVRHRSWGSCQENDTSPSAYYTSSVELFRVVLAETGEVITTVLSKEHGKNIIERLTADPKKSISQINKGFKELLKALEAAHKKESKLWLTEAETRKRLALAGKDIGDRGDLTEILKSYNLLWEG